MVLKHRIKRDMPPEEEEDVKFVNSSNTCAVKNDFTNICLLMFLYVMQGIPLGLAAAVPYLLQSDENTANYQTQATFSLAAWPFSLKLLWAPLVDSIYSTRFGRRKSWLIPVQYAIGIDLLVLANYVDEWLGRELGNPWGPLGVAHSVNIYSLTLAFFSLTLLAATQDIAVDGWALTMLSKRNISWASTCNSVGQTLGYVIAFILFLCLESPDISNSYLRVTPVEGKGLVTFSGFLYFWGIAFLVTTTIVLVLKHEERATLTQPVQRCLDATKHKTATSSIMKRLQTRLFSLHLRLRRPNIAPLTTPVDDEEVTDVSMLAPDSDLFVMNDVSANGISRPSSLSVLNHPNQGMVSRSNSIIQVFSNDTDPEFTPNKANNHDLSLLDTYRVTVGILCLKPVLQYIGTLFLVKICFAASDSIATLKLIEHGVSKERLAFLSMVLLPFQAVLPLFITRWTNGPRPLGVYTVAGVFRLVLSSVIIPLVHYTPYFAHVPVAVTVNQTLNNSFSVNMTTSHAIHPTFSWKFYGILLAYTAVYSLVASFMFVSQMAFHAKISDPAVGGTYMTLLNTAANMAAILPSTILLYLVDPLSIRYCTKSDSLKAGLASWHSSLTDIRDNKTQVPGQEQLLLLGQQWLTHNATCKPLAGVHACQLAGGECTTVLDGFYLEVVVCILIGLFTFPLIVRPLARRLDSLPPSAFSFRLSESKLCRRKQPRR